MNEDNDDNESMIIEEVKAENDSNSDGGEYEVEAILRVKAFIKENVLKYQIRWVGYSEDYDSWEPEENLLGAEDVLKNFKQTHAAELERALKMLEKSNKQASRRSATTKKANGLSTASEKKKGTLKTKHGERSSDKAAAGKDVISSDDEDFILTKRRVAEQPNCTLKSNGKDGKQRLEFSPRKLHNSWMYKDLDEDTDDDENTNNGSSSQKNGRRRNTSKSDQIVKIGDLKIPVSNDNKGEGKVDIDDLLKGKDSKFTACFMKPDGSIHMLRGCGEMRCSMPIKEAHERYGFEVVEYLISHADFK